LIKAKDSAEKKREAEQDKLLKAQPDTLLVKVITAHASKAAAAAIKELTKQLNLDEAMIPTTEVDTASVGKLATSLKSKNRKTPSLGSGHNSNTHTATDKGLAGGTKN
jgi:hypothetical protein